MASHDPAALRPARQARERHTFDKGQKARRGGSISLVLAIAGVLVAAATGLMYVGRDYIEAYVLILLAGLGGICVFALFVPATRLMRFSSREQREPFLKTGGGGAF